MINDLLTQFSTSLLSQGLSRNTRYNYLADVKKFLNWYKTHFQSQPTHYSITPNHFQLYSQYLKQSGTSRVSIDRYLATLKRFYAFIHPTVPQSPPIRPFEHMPQIKPLPVLDTVKPGKLILTLQAVLDLGNKVHAGFTPLTVAGLIFLLIVSFFIISIIHMSAGVALAGIALSIAGFSVGWRSTNDSLKFLFGLIILAVVMWLAYAVNKKLSN